MTECMINHWPHGPNCVKPAITRYDGDRAQFQLVAAWRGSELVWVSAVAKPVVERRRYCEWQCKLCGDGTQSVDPVAAVNAHLREDHGPGFVCYERKEAEARRRLETWTLGPRPTEDRFGLPVPKCAHPVVEGSTEEWCPLCGATSDA